MVLLECRACFIVLNKGRIKGISIGLIRNVGPTLIGLGETIVGYTIDIDIST